MYVRELPIPTLSDEIKKSLSSKVDVLLQLHKERKELIGQSLEILKTEYAIRQSHEKIRKLPITRLE